MFVINIQSSLCIQPLFLQLFHEQYKWLETTIYVFVALAPAYAVFEMVRPSFFVILMHYTYA